MAAIRPTPPNPERATTATPDRARPDAVTRFIAFFIDAAIVAIVGLVPVIGGIVGIAYVLVRDGLTYDFMDGRSIGKRIMKLRPVRLDGLPMDVETSIRRNWTLVFGSLAQALVFVPVIGWILIPFVGIAGTITVVIEIVRVLTGVDGRRWGDTMAGTEVVVVAD
jgi:uncharacterized RDD family membrane protein YckC